MNAAIIMSLIVGWFLGFVTHFSVRTAYKELIKVLEDEKKPLKDGHPTVGNRV
ncbi:hypothetical protein [Carnobacterium sp. 17-4]|uniref:hypothetical protein n=1 Tax=Carnobacterium sp. (strain 17-4) TaxID=208596 RepID=UPI0013051838|nr:hypothetical protein [Carnobacterium sp. 17-4]